jgi:perosamine synthetase
VIDLFRASMSPEAGDAVKRVLTPDEKGRVYCGEGQITKDFETQFAEVTGLRQLPLGTNSCTASIDMALHMLGVGPGDEVICTPMTCSATNGSVVNRGAKIVWADVDPITGLISPESIGRVVSSYTKAILAVDWAGRKCDYQVIRDAIGWQVPIIEDAAHCIYLGDTTGDYVAWSFGPIKHLSCGGYGGALLTPSHDYDRARLLRWHGLDRLSKADFRCSQDITEVGYRYHMTDDQAAIGLANLELAKANVAEARRHARDYCRLLRNVSGLAIPPYDAGCDYWLFGLIVEGNRDAFAESLAANGIPTSRAHARNDKHTAFAQATTHQDGELPGVTYFDDHQINIPVGRWVTDHEIDFIISCIEKALEPSKQEPILQSL